MTITRACKRLSITCIAFWLLTLTSSLPSYGKDQVDSAQRLRFLRNTLGQGSNQTSFEAKVDSMMNVSADSSRAVIASQDAKVRAEAMQSNMIESILSTGLTDEDFQNQILQRIGEELDEEKESKTGILDSQIQGAEKDFLINQEKFYRDEETKRAKVTKITTESEETAEEEKASDELAPSLSQNPFYHKPVKDFYANKYLIANRLMATGMDFEEAQGYVNPATSPEELIMDLMDDEGFTYGEAKSFLSFE